MYAGKLKPDVKVVSTWPGLFAQVVIGIKLKVSEFHRLWVYTDRLIHSYVLEHKRYCAKDLRTGLISRRTLLSSKISSPHRSTAPEEGEVGW